jgi:hypothetical protein
MRVFLAALLCALVAPAAASASADGADYNKPFNTADVSDCVHPKSRTGIAAFAFDGSYLPFALDVRTAWPGCEHAPGSMRVLKLQTLTAGGRTTYLARGGGAGRPHVHVSASDLQRPPALLPFGARNGNGRGAPGCTSAIYARPTELPQAMKYKPSQPRSSGASWDNYGDPGAALGSHFTYLLWNLPRRDVAGVEEEIGGGGIVMAALKPRQELLVCDVSLQRLDAFAPGAAAPSGETEWAYVVTSNGAETLRGWVMVGARYDGVAYQLFDWT